MLVPGVPAVNDASAKLREVSALIDAYLSHLAVERRLSPNTVESYGRDLTHLLQFAAGLEKPVEDLDRRGLEALERQLMGEGRSPTSVARAVACFRGFYRFLVVSGRRTANPADDLAFRRGTDAPTIRVEGLTLAGA